MFFRNKLFNIRKKIIISCLFFLILAGAFLLPSLKVLAEEVDQFGLNYAANIGLSNQDPRVAIINIIRIALTFLGIIAVILIMYAGFIWMTSAGNENKIETAKKILINAVIGLIIIIASFLIVSFILNKLTGGSGFFLPRRGQEGGWRGGISALGNCAIESVYPAPMQRDVPRNTSIVVTFKEEVNANSIYDPANNNLIRTNSVKIFTRDDEANLVANVRAFTNDNLTFVFMPVEYLGSPVEYIWYSVLLTNDITNRAGEGIFNKCGINKSFSWQFEVSNLVDLTPPQIVRNGIFPLPDNEIDLVTGAAAVAASGTITVVSQPLSYSPAALSSSVSPLGGSPAASVVVYPNCRQGGEMTVTVQANGHTAQLSRDGVLLGSAEFTDNRAVFANLFEITSLSEVASGNSWRFSINPERPADTLTVGSVVYSFTSGSAGIYEILIGANLGATALNISNALNSHPDIIASVSANRVTITARIAGSAGNNIVLSSNAGTRLSIVAMAGGQNSSQTVTIRDKRDQPRNAVIQINFNEGMNPLTLSGSAQQLANYIRVVNAAAGALGAGAACVSNAQCLSYLCDGTCQGDYITGKFIISNQYRTVEFLSDVVCGVNGCGEQIFCLPANSQLRVEITAAALEGCVNCPAKSPFTGCVSGHCVNPANNEFYPQAAFPLSGAADLALNSLDGDRSGAAEGPADFYNENIASGNGDSYRWSFFINDMIDIAPPRIDSTLPAHQGNNASLFDPVRIVFDKLMMSASFRTGTKIIDNGREKIPHRHINIWNFTNTPVGYWITKEDLDVPPFDGYPDRSVALINHTMFADSTTYRSQAGSGVKDIYQNCFSPSAGTTCAATNSQRSCCPAGAVINPIPSASLVNGNCP